MHSLECCHYFFLLQVNIIELLLFLLQINKFVLLLFLLPVNMLMYNVLCWISLFIFIMVKGTWIFVVMWKPNANHRWVKCLRCNCKHALTYQVDKSITFIIWLLCMHMKESLEKKTHLRHNPGWSFYVCIGVGGGVLQVWCSFINLSDSTSWICCKCLGKQHAQILQLLYYSIWLTLLSPEGIVELQCFCPCVHHTWTLWTR